MDERIKIDKSRGRANGCRAWMRHSRGVSHTPCLSAHFRAYVNAGRIAYAPTTRRCPHIVETRHATSLQGNAWHSAGMLRWVENQRPGARAFRRNASFRLCCRSHSYGMRGGCGGGVSTERGIPTECGGPRSDMIHCVRRIYHIYNVPK
jgi:hypothetical protein